MRHAMLAFHPTLAERSRLIALAPHRAAVHLWELAVLAGCGLLAAGATVFLDFNLRIPGHSILRAILPMSLGLALVPRRGAGFVMSGAALIGMVGVGLGGFSAGAGALTSLLCLGPLLDAASRLANRGGWLIVAFGIAALLSNVMAFIVRAVTRLGGGNSGGSGAGWWSIAPVTYGMCGLLAGILCAAIWFRWRASATPPSGGARP
jgi:hypothetical protein